MAPEKCMSDIHLMEVLFFLDDLIVFSDTLEEHETRLTNMLSRLDEYGLKLSPDKCKFSQTTLLLLPSNYYVTWDILYPAME